MRRAKLRGTQLDIRFPIRGRPTRRRQLEKCGQMQLELRSASRADSGTSVRVGRGDESSRQVTGSVVICSCPEGFDEALQMTFPVAPPTEDELYRDFCRMFPA